MIGISEDEELLMSQVVHTEALTRLHVEEGVFTKEEFLEMVRVVDREWKRKKESLQHTKKQFPPNLPL